MRKTLTVKIEGQDDGDLEIAIEEVLGKVREGYTSGFDRNETGNYSFEIKEA